MLFHLINMSDPYTFEAPDLKTAALTTLLLGGGEYGAESEDKSLEVPVMLLVGREGIVQWFKDKCDLDITGVTIGDMREPVGKCLASFVIGSFEQRKIYEDMRTVLREDLQTDFKIKWHDDRRSSLNDIGRRAWRLSEQLLSLEVQDAQKVWTETE